MDFWDHINIGESYLCDRCNVVELRNDEYNNKYREFRYCDECFRYINLSKWKCHICNTTGTHRSERTINIYHCDEPVSWLK